MFGADHVGDRARIHPAQNFQPLAGIPRQDTAQYRGGFIFAQRPLQHRFDVIGHAQPQVGLLFDSGKKLVKHCADGFLRKIRHRNHCSPQRLHFFRVKITDDFCRLLLAKQQHEHCSTLDVCQPLHFIAKFLIRLRVFVRSGVRTIRRWSCGVFCF